MDYRTRTVPNKYWITLALVGGVAAAVEGHLAARLLALLVTAVASFALWLGKQFGGADAKAIMISAALIDPVTYWNPDSARFLAAIDALALALVVGEAWRRWKRYEAIPWLVAYTPSLAAVLVLGGLLWWPIVILARWLT